MSGHYICDHCGYDGGEHPEWCRNYRVFTPPSTRSHPTERSMSINELNDRVTADGFKQYRRTQIAEMKPWRGADNMDGVSVAGVDKLAGSPKPGDMIARNPKNHADLWLVAAAYFADNFEPL